MHYPEPLAKLMESFMKLPGIGEKTASRLAFYTMDMDEEDIKSFAKALISVQEDLSHCPICGNITDQEICEICADETRDSGTILVVESPTDVVAFEKVREYRGYYHVLQGVISPAEGKGPNDINIQSLIQRLQKNEEIGEVIIATNATSEGEATAMYLSRLIKPSGIKVTRLAHGLSAGSDIEFADEITLQKAVSGRQEM